MYDNQIAEVLRKTYGDENFRIYCEMQVLRNKLADEELGKLNGEPTDADFEAYFWQRKLNELLEEPNH
jgi:hypothetical protein